MTSTTIRAISRRGAVSARRVPIRIVGLNPSPGAIAYFHAIFGPSAPIIEATRSCCVAAGDTVPWGLVVLVLIAGLALASREGWAPILAWRRSP